LTCPQCGFDLRDAPLYSEWRVCDNCGHHFPLNALQRIKTLADPKTFHELEKYLATHPRGFEYAQRVREAKRKTHLREAVVIGTAKIHNCELMLVVLDFRFMGGTMGEAAGEKITRAFEHAAERKLPLVAVTASGGARIQEGMVALMQMAKTVAAVNRFEQLGLPYITVLTNPTTGGVYASFANLADVILAEPRALIGFAGPRVVEILTHEKLPKDSHRAEFLLEHGMVDAVVLRTELRRVIGNVLGTVQARGNPLTVPIPLKSGTNSTMLSSWESVQLARHPDRPTTLDYLQRVFTDFVELHGDHFYGDDPAIIAGVAKLQGQGVVVIGQERGHGEARIKHHEGKAEPEGYRKAERLMRLASKWNLPIVTFVDTPGASPGYEAEKRGIAMSLAHSIATMLQMRVPTIAVVIGEGGSGGALALAAADRVLMLEHAVYSVISPEGASAILYGDDAHASELAETLHLTAHDLRKRRIIDEIIPEPVGGAHKDAAAAAQTMKAYLLHALNELVGKSSDELRQARYEKYRAMGNARSEG